MNYTMVLKKKNKVMCLPDMFYLVKQHKMLMHIFPVKEERYIFTAAIKMSVNAKMFIIYISM